MLCNDLTPLNEIGDSQQLGTWDAEQLPHRLPWGRGGAGGGADVKGQSSSSLQESEQEKVLVSGFGTPSTGGSSGCLLGHACV